MMRMPGGEVSELQAACDSATGTAAPRIVRDAAAPGGGGDLLTLRCVVGDDVALERQDDRHVVVVNTASNARLRLSRGLYRLMRRFDTPRSLEQVVGAERAARLLPQLRMLLDKRMLIDADAPRPVSAQRVRGAVAYRFCNAPAFAVSAAPADFVVLGLGYDLGGELDCRGAPAAIRRKSLEYAYRLGFDDGRPLGWFDAGRDAWILRGAGIADGGDVPVDYAQPQSALFERLDAALAQVCHGASVAVLIGGDRSVSYAAVDRLRRRGPLSVVQFAATPPDRGADAAGPVAADALAARLLHLPGVEGFHCVGGNAAVAGVARPRLSIVSAGDLRRDGPQEFARGLGERRSIYLSIDLSVTTPGYVRPMAGASTSPGLRLHEIKAAIAALGAAHRIVGIDLVGLDAHAELAEIRAVAACHLALAAMSAAHDR